jgi:hypothetical protein
MTTTDWHVPDALLRRFTEDPGAIDDVTASSIEAHVIACARCRGRMADAAAPSFVATSWDAIADRIDRPRPSAVQRLLERLGVDGGLARLLAATPALRAAGLAAVVGLAVAAAVLSRTADAEGPFLVLAPLAPLAAVAASFAPASDPAGEAGAATPLHGVGLVVRRALAVLLVTFGSLGLAALALPDLGLEAMAWALPALALALGALCLSTFVRTEVGVTVLAVAWLMGVSTVRWLAGRELAYAASPTFSLVGQLTAAALALVALALLVARRDRFATLEVLS